MLTVVGKATSWMVVGASAGEMTVPLMVNNIVAVVRIINFYQVGLLQEKWGMVVLMYGSTAVLALATVVYVILILRVNYVRRGATLQRSYSNVSEDSLGEATE